MLCLKEKPIALLSVYHKIGIVKFAQQLVALGWRILASGGTAKVLQENGVAVIDVATFAGIPQMFKHRLVTLTHKIHGGLLAQFPEDADEMKAYGFEYIDLVCVDFYPMQNVINQPGASLASVLEMTDIGGPAMLRSGAKGNRIVICDPDDRQRVIDWLKGGMENHNGFVNDLAAKAEMIVAQYCLASAKFRSQGKYH